MSDRLTHAKSEADSSWQDTSSARLFALIHSQHGSFSRFFKIHSRSHKQTRAESPNSRGVGQQSTLFPSVLPWTHPPSGKSKNRRGYHKKVAREAFEWLRRIWVLMNFLHVGSPASSNAASKAIQDASHGEWTAMHESYARTMYEKLKAYCACPRGTMERGSAKLNTLIEKIESSMYDPSISMDDATCGALDVNPERISMPDVAGIIGPPKSPRWRWVG